ncbi:MAG: HDIG domain-containing metalloprotein [Solirubrobacterales bacterium]
MSSVDYKDVVLNILNHPEVKSMENYIQHSNISCLDHCISVSYYSYSICRVLGFDYKAAARGGLLHDFFQYDWHIPSSEHNFHGFTHPKTALNNSKKYFLLNEVEQDIISKHMWPLTIKIPKYKEAMVVCFVDKFCAIMEIIGLYKRDKFYNILNH